MKTIPQIKKEIASIQQQYSDKSKFKDSEYKKAGRKITFLRKCIIFLERHPSKKILEKQRAEVEIHLDFIGKNFGVWRSNQATSRQEELTLQKYNAAMSTRKFKLQRATIDYLLS